jgi:hypothetical protein
MQAKRKDVVAMFEGLGVNTAESWPADKAMAKLRKLERYEPNKGNLSGPLLELYNDFETARAADEKVELTGWDEDGEAPAEKPAKAKAGKPAAKKGKSGKKSGPPRKAGGDGRPGVVESIVKHLRAARPGKGLTKKQVLAKLCAEFPDRGEESMWNTTSSQIPNRIYKERGLKVHGDKNGFWIVDKAGAKPSANGKASSKAKAKKKAKAE